MGISKEYWMSGRNWQGGRHQLDLLQQARECLLVEIKDKTHRHILLIFYWELVFMLLEYDDEVI